MGAFIASPSQLENMRQNIELKARLVDLEAARSTAKRIATESLGIQHQIDTYFHCQEGRLKLREITRQQAQLVWYSRENVDNSKLSDYQLVAIDDATGLKTALTSGLGVRAIVRKRRDIYLFHNVRIHLDEVEGLGTFLEFESVLSDGISAEEGHEQLRRLQAEFEIVDDQLLSGSYGEMVDSCGGR